MLNADQHLAGSRGRRFWNLDMLEDIRWLPESFYPPCAHSLPPLLRETAEHDQIQTGERASGLLHAATNHQPAELDRHEAKLRISPRRLLARVVPGNKDHAICRTSPTSLKRAVTTNESLDDAGAWRQAATTSLALFPPRSARGRASIGLDEGFVASDEHAAVPGGQPCNADSTFRQGTASNTSAAWRRPRPRPPTPHDR
jgi:hypothetical protein